MARICPVETTYYDVEGLIHYCVRKVHRLCRREEYEELFAEANLVFVLTYKSFDYKEGVPFSFWLCKKIKYALLQRMENQLRRKRLLPRTILEDLQAEEIRWKMDDFLECLSDDGVEAVCAAFEEAQGEVSDFHNRQAVVRRLKEIEWTHERIKAAFAEVQLTLEDI